MVGNNLKWSAAGQMGSQANTWHLTSGGRARADSYSLMRIIAEVLKGRSLNSIANDLLRASRRDRADAVADDGGATCHLPADPGTSGVQARVF